MKEEDFKKFIKMVDDAYPKQRDLNLVQKGFFWLALRDYSTEKCIRAFSAHTQQSEWKPQVCDIIKHLTDNETEIKKYLLDFFARKDVRDETANKVYRVMGINRLRKTLENDYEDVEERFVELYKNFKTEKRLEELPNKLQKKLINGEKNE
tara:strand:- start:12 stop:464 length:453 start_codon:yes stop_codon:yes gene_type:complete